MPAPVDNESVLEDVSRQLKRIGDEIKPLAEKALKQSEDAGKLSLELKAEADKQLAKQGELQARLQSIEQKLDDVKNHGDERRADEKSLGDRLTESEDFIAWAKGASRKSGSFSFGVKAITSLPASAGDGIAPDRLPGIVIQPDRQFYVRDLIAPGRTTSNAIQYVRETGFTNNAAPVSETILKPESTLTYDLLTAPVVTIAHWVHASKQILDDFAALGSQIDQRLRYGLKIVEDAQILKGSGVGNNLNGIYTQATAYVAPAGAPASATTKIDILRLMLLQAVLAEYDPDGIVLNPTDWAFIELTKTTEGAYVFANPTQMAGPRLWARPVVATKSMTADQALVGAFRMGAQIFDREDANVQISTEDRDNFVKNMVTIRGEERLALTVTRPEAFIKNDNLPAT